MKTVTITEIKLSYNDPNDIYTPTGEFRLVKNEEYYIGERGVVRLKRAKKTVHDPKGPAWILTRKPKIIVPKYLTGPGWFYASIDVNGQRDWKFSANRNKPSLLANGWHSTEWVQVINNFEWPDRGEANKVPIEEACVKVLSAEEKEWEEEDDI